MTFFLPPFLGDFLINEMIQEHHSVPDIKVVYNNIDASI